MQEIFACEIRQDKTSMIDRWIDKRMETLERILLGLMTCP